MCTYWLFYKLSPIVLPNSKGNDTKLLILMLGYKEKVQM